MRAIRYLWALPATCVGACLGLLCLLRGARVRLVEGAIEVGGGLPRRFPFGAITFGHVIIGHTAEGLEDWRAHEQVHVRQYERWGVLFFALYAASSIREWLRGNDPYRDNRFEREAYGSAGRAGAKDVTPRPGGG
ncbi:MAG: hypothetical protein ACM3SO_22490 [Betaproteobacteria bacterium]